MNFVFSAESNKRSFLSQAPVQILWSIFTNLFLQHSKFICSSEKTLLLGSCGHCENWCLGNRSDLTKPSKDQEICLKLGTDWIPDSGITSSGKQYEIKQLMLIKDTHWFLSNICCLQPFFCACFISSEPEIWQVLKREVYTEKLHLFFDYKEKRKNYCLM